MTTILADYRLRVMVADSMLADDDRAWNIRKINRIRGALVGCSGEMDKWSHFLAWWKAGAEAEPAFDFSGCSALVLSATGLYIFDDSTIALTKVDGGREAIGSGGKGAICAYEALGWQDPRKAVRIAVKHDAKSRGPVRVFTLKEAS